MDNIVLITDFGNKDPYIGQVKGVIYSNGFTGRIIDYCNNVNPFSILNAQFILYSGYRYFPQNSIFLIIVDPGVGTQRDILIATDGCYYFIVPDNGIISAIDSNVDVYRLILDDFNNVSSTFHGRDIFAKVASNLACYGFKSLNVEKKEDYKKIEFPVFRIEGNKVFCKIVHVDIFGNCILSLPNDVFGLKDVNLINPEKIKLKFINTYADLKDNEYGILLGSQNFVEISMNKKSIADLLNLKIEDEVEFFYE